MMEDLDDEDDISLDITPMIDVIFMLLIFFIVATTFVKPMFEVALPEADGVKTVSEKEKRPVCAVTIDAEGNTFFDGEETPPERFPEKFAAGSDTVFEVFSDEASPFGVVVKLMDAAKKQGNESLLFMVEKKR